MLKLVDQPNTINTEDYEGAPHTADLAYVQYDGTGEASHMCALWPAEINGEHRVVAVSNSLALSMGARRTSSTTKTSRGALQRFRPLIERRANELLVKGAREVVLDVGALTKELSV
jgi:hypothetical protein